MESKKLNISLKWYIIFGVITAISIISLIHTPNFNLKDDFLTEDNLVASDIAWILTSSCLVLLMTPGLSFFYGGMVGKKNIISTMLQSFICLGVISIIWILFGFSLSFGDSTLSLTINGTKYGIVGNLTQYAFFDQLGILPHKDIASTIPFLLFAMFQMKFAVITPAIITGSFAERVRFISYVVFICLFTVIIYTPLCHSVWHPDGIIGGYFGVKDFAGGTVVHMSAGIAALSGAMFIGKRKVIAHNPTNIPFVLLGTGMLWFGWFGFNAGSSLAADGTAVKAFATTSAASAMAMITWIFFDRINGRRISALGACIGCVVGLVAITPAAGFVSISESIFFGFSTAIVSNVCMYSKFFKKYDDTLDVFACHGVGGIMGMILTAIFSNEEGTSLLHGGWTIFSHHMMALCIVFVFTFIGSLVLFKLTNLIIPMRVKEKNEALGLDITQHNEQYV